MNTNAATLGEHHLFCTNHVGEIPGALSGFFIGIGLTIVGYVPNTVQSDTTIFGLKVMMIGVPLLLIALSAVIYRFGYRLHDALQREVVEHITRARDVA